MNEVVKYHNDVNKISFRGFRAVDMDLFWTMANRIREKGTEQLIFSREEIQALAHYNEKHRTIDMFKKDMVHMANSLMKLSTCMEIEDEKGNKGMSYFVLFQEFEVFDDRVEVKVSRRFEMWFNLIAGAGNFTRFELDNLIKLKSGYSKEIYRRLMQFKSTGFWTISMEEFREQLAIPKSYAIRDIDKRVLKIVERELTTIDELDNSIFEYLRIKKIKGGYRNSQIVRLEFSFKICEQRLLSQKEIEKKTAEQVYKQKTAKRNSFSAEKDELELEKAHVRTNLPELSEERVEEIAKRTIEDRRAGRI